MYFKKLEIRHWQQFEEVDIDFHDKLTILTGSNGSGKTTILNLFARHFGWNLYSLSTPKEKKDTGDIKFLAGFFADDERIDTISIGKIKYSNGQEANLSIKNENRNVAQYQIELTNQQPVKCFYIPSHKAIPIYKRLVNIPTARKSKLSAFRDVFSINERAYLGRQNHESISFVMKNTLIGWVINGYGVANNNKVIMAKDNEQIAFFEGFQETLRKILPKTLGFKEFAIRNMEIVFVCNDGADEFLLETASGGISALIDMAWQIFMYASKENTDFTVIIDEVENHLHPIMQRSILQDLIDAFPSARFIVSTHSPLVVGSVKDSNIYALTYNNENKVQSRKLDFLGEAKTASEILDEVLGVSFTMPIWVETKLNAIIDKYNSASITEQSMSNLRKELSELGLGRMLPYAIQSIAESEND